ncbi:MULTISPECIES: hypothetical protein [Amycolatopsis]|uniref:Uncharacterized protein n=1 Tax=Amycolatopsis bullii TaxID=941987 RepID=A0ABQ3KJA0_9PSEU|nr:hypothetical protein [Amycolatopsis bullii]GHG29988.1 hypothetical protein GCM10017567_57270 [Amycolatopsis bullii]
MPLIARRRGEANRIVAHTTTQAGRGEFVDNVAALAVTTALADNTIYGPMLLPPAEFGPQRVEQLRMALCRSTTDPRTRARPATFIAASTLRRDDQPLTSRALAHGHGALGAAAIGVLFQQHAEPHVVENELDMLTGRVGATRW